jgi:hypothetical protein
MSEKKQLILYKVRYCHIILTVRIFVAFSLIAPHSTVFVLVSACCWDVLFDFTTGNIIL